MKHKKYVSIASSLGLSIALLAGCGTNQQVDNNKMNPNQSQDKDDKVSNNGGVVAPPGVTNFKSSSESGSKSSKGASTVKGSTGIGAVKGGGAGS